MSLKFSLIAEFANTFASCTDPGHLHSTSINLPRLSQQLEHLKKRIGPAMVLLRLRFQINILLKSENFFSTRCLGRSSCLTLFHHSSVLPRATQTDLGFLSRLRLLKNFCLWINIFFKHILLLIANLFFLPSNSYIISIAFNIIKMVHCSNINDKHWIHFLEAAKNFPAI